jgi:hypothetical protein
MKFFIHALYIPLLILNKKARGLAILFKVVLASLKIALTTSIAPSLEIPSCS